MIIWRRAEQSARGVPMHKLCCCKQLTHANHSHDTYRSATFFERAWPFGGLSTPLIRGGSQAASHARGAAPGFAASSSAALRSAARCIPLSTGLRGTPFTVLVRSAAGILYCASGRNRPDGGGRGVDAAELLVIPVRVDCQHTRNCGVGSTATRASRSVSTPPRAM